jgi:hypothetical protein
MAKKPREPLFDNLGREITLGSPVAFFHRAHKHMQAGRVTKLSKVNVTVTWTNGKTSDWRRIRSTDVVIVEEDAYVFNFLRTGIG